MENELPIGQNLITIVITEDTLFKGNALCLDELQLIFPGTTLTLQPNPETDEIELRQNSTKSFPNKIIPQWCQPFINQTLSAVWFCENHQGYRDQLIISFHQLHPSLSILCEGSVLKLFLHQPILKTASHPLPPIQLPQSNLNLLPRFL